MDYPDYPAPDYALLFGVLPTNTSCFPASETEMAPICVLPFGPLVASEGLVYLVDLNE